MGPTSQLSSTQLPFLSLYLLRLRRRVSERTGRLPRQVSRSVECSSARAGSRAKLAAPSLDNRAGGAAWPSAWAGGRVEPAASPAAESAGGIPRLRVCATLRRGVLPRAKLKLCAIVAAFFSFTDDVAAAANCSTCSM